MSDSQASIYINIETSGQIQNIQYKHKQIRQAFTIMDKMPALGGPNNPKNRRKEIESEINLREMIIIDNGTQSIKFGRSGSDYPSVIVPTITGYPSVISENDATPPKKMYFGKELQQMIETKKYKIQFQRPIVNSRIGGRLPGDMIPDKSIEEVVALYGYAIGELMGVDLQTASLLIIDSPMNSKEYKAQLVQILFDKLKVQSILFMNSSVLSLFSIGETIGLVTQIGEGSTTVVPVFEGFILNHALETSLVAGGVITQILEEEIKKNKIVIQSKDELHEQAIIKKMKEDNIKAAFDYQSELHSDGRSQEERSYELPDGTVIQLTKETVHRPVQILFQQYLTESSFSHNKINRPLPEMIDTSLSRCSEELRGQMLKRMVFCGGSSMIKGLPERLDKQMEQISTDYKFEFDWQRRYSSWIGGSMIGSLSTFQKLAIKNDELSTNEIIKKIL